MSSNNWYVLTGGPGSGKTTLLEELRRRGHNVVGESARYYIENQLAAGLTLGQIRKDEKAFQEAVFRHKQAAHKGLNPKSLIFFDRGYHDTIAYLKYHKQPIATFITQACNNMTYKRVCVLDMLPYRNDKVRKESHTTALGIHAALINAYQQSGYEIIHIPPNSVTKRADFIEFQITP